MNTVLFTPPSPIARAHKQLDEIFTNASPAVQENLLLYLKMLEKLWQLQPTPENRKTIEDMHGNVEAHLAYVLSQWGK